MLFSSFLAVTLTPVLMTMFIRGKIRPEEKNPISRVLHKSYKPVAHFAIRFQKTVIISAIIITLMTVYPFMKLDSEFMSLSMRGRAVLYVRDAARGGSL